MLDDKSERLPLLSEDRLRLTDCMNFDMVLDIWDDIPIGGRDGALLTDLLFDILDERDAASW